MLLEDVEMTASAEPGSQADLEKPAVADYQDTAGESREEPGLTPRLISLREASKYINVSYATIWRLVCKGTLRACRVAGVWRTSINACDQFIDQQFAEQALLCKSVEVD